MRLTRLYDPQPLSLHQVIELTPFAAKHIALVLRARVDDEVIVFNGEGGEYRAVIRDIKKQKVTVELMSFENKNVESLLSIHLIQAISRPEHMDYTLQKATELGVTEITPVITAHSPFRLEKNRAEKRQAHWQNILVSSSEQSGRTVLPCLNAVKPLEEYLAALPAPAAETARWIAHPIGGASLKKIQNPLCRFKSIVLLIGAEGGFSQLEIDLAKRFDFQVLSLGPRVLRTETAAVTAISLLQYEWGDLG